MKLYYAKHIPTIFKWVNVKTKWNLQMVHLFIKEKNCAKLFWNLFTNIEVTFWTNPDRWTFGQTHTHTPKCCHDNYVSNITSGLDKNYQIFLVISWRTEKLNNCANVVETLHGVAGAFKTIAAFDSISYMLPLIFVYLWSYRCNNTICRTKIWPCRCQFWCSWIWWHLLFKQ